MTAPSGDPAEILILLLGQRVVHPLSRGCMPSLFALVILLATRMTDDGGWQEVVLQGLGTLFQRAAGTCSTACF